MARFLLVLIFTSVLAYGLYRLFNGRPFLSLNLMRRKGGGVLKGRPTMFHVRELLVRQDKEMAIQVYCEIFGVNRKEAKRAVDELERSIQEKR